VIVVVAGSTLMLTLYANDRYSLLYYGDAVSHLVGARRLLDWERTGLEMLGTVWLPLPKLLFMLPAQIDALFFTGMAGSLVSLPATVVTTLILHRLLSEVWREHAGRVCMLRSRLALNDKVPLLFSMLYPLNLNILYLGIVAMTESLFMLFFTASAYYLYIFMKYSKIRDLYICSILIALATLTRYEAWLLPLSLIVLLVTHLMNRDGRNNYGYKDILHSMIIASTGVVIWLVYNHHFYGDMLEFVDAVYYSASWQAMHREVRDMLFMQPLNVIRVYGITAYVFYAPLLIVALYSMISIISRKGKGKGKGKDNAIWFYLALPSLFTLSSMLIGVGEMDLWFNSRFLVFLAPILLLLSIRSISIRGALIVVVVVILYQLVFTESICVEYMRYIIQVYTSNCIVTYEDAKAGYYASSDSFKVGEFIRSRYSMSDAKIMVITGSMQEHKIMISSWIELSRYDEIIESSRWKDSFHEPWLYSDVIVIGKSPDDDAVSVAEYWLSRLDTLKRFYDTVYEDDRYIVLERYTKGSL
jgi:hypothetical protein